MCESRHNAFRHGRRGRRGFPNREQLIERLTGYRQHLESELANVQDLLERLGETPGSPEATIETV